MHQLLDSLVKNTPRALSGPALHAYLKNPGVHANPKGISAQSPGLRGTSYPGKSNTITGPTPMGLWRTLVLAFLAATTIHAASLTPLGDLPGGSFQSYARGVSADGSVVVGESRSAPGTEAFRWSAGVMTGLGDLEGGDFNSAATAVSADGSVIVGNGDSGNSMIGTEAFRWTAAGGMIGLGGPQGGIRQSEATGVSADGSVVVGRSAAGSFYEAFRWTAESGMTGLGDLPGGFFNSSAEGISADGKVIVGQGRSTQGDEAFRWTEGGMTGLGDFPGVDFVSKANAASADGSVIVGEGYSDLGTEAFRWTTEGMVALGEFDGGTYLSQALAVSGDGRVVVGTSRSAVNIEAFLWTAAKGFRKLADELVALGVDPAADQWSRLIEATGISADGRYVVGYGSRNGHGEGFLADLSGAGGGPRLEYERTSEGLRLEWPAGFRLQRTPSLAPAAWQEAASAAPVTVPMDASHQFYRLISVP
jgi:probable HAF family extracellular repeat protein